MYNYYKTLCIVLVSNDSNRSMIYYSSWIILLSYQYLKQHRTVFHLNVHLVTTAESFVLAGFPKYSPQLQELFHNTTACVIFWCSKFPHAHTRRDTLLFTTILTGESRLLISWTWLNFLQLFLTMQVAWNDPELTAIVPIMKKKKQAFLA